jgi:hypothetical protein
MRNRIVGCAFTLKAPIVFAICLVAGNVVGASSTAQRTRSLTDAATVTGQDNEQHQQLFETAEKLFRSESQPESIDIFRQIITALESQTANRQPSEDERRILIQSLLLRAEAQFNLGETDTVTQDLQQVINVDPAMQLDTSQVSPRFVALFENLLAESVGYLVLLVSPPDAEVRIDGTVIDTTQLQHSLLAGLHTIVARRAGFDAVQTEVVVDAATEVQSALVLEATSAVLRLLTRPPGANVSLDATAVGTTTGVAHGDIVLSGDARLYPLEDFSDELIVGGLQPGLHRIEVSLDGFRPSRHEISVRDRVDYQAVVVLEPTEGRVLLEDLPNNVVLSVNDVVTTPEPPSSDMSITVPFLKLPVGEHRISVDGGTRGRFEATVDVADLESIAVPVQVRPTIAFLGVLGGDELGSQAVMAAIDETFMALDGWSLLDRTNRGLEILEQAGVTIEALRTLGDSQVTPTGTFDWEVLQTAVDEQMPSSVYLLGVLSNDVVATYADLWVWLPAPNLATGDYIRVSLNQTDPAISIAEAFAPELVMEQPWLGLLLIDSNAAEGPVVAAVTPESPAANGGIQVGDVLVGIDTNDIQTVAQAMRLVSRMTPHETVSLLMNRNETDGLLELTVGTTPTVASLNDEEVLYPVLLTRLSALVADDTQSETNWIIRLNRAEALFKAGSRERAVQELRAIEGTLVAGPEKAAVNYRLGVMLETLGPTYLEAARQALARATGVPDARLLHEGGPWVAPRALVRLRELVQADAP